MSIILKIDECIPFTGRGWNDGTKYSAEYLFTNFIKRLIHKARIQNLPVILNFGELSAISDDFVDILACLITLELNIIGNVEINIHSLSHDRQDLYDRFKKFHKLAKNNLKKKKLFLF